MSNSTLLAPPELETTVPERPALAPNVHLIGEMTGTGFKDSQWLILRADQFLQVSELIYRIAEQANGEQTLHEIAVRISDSSDRIVSAAQVQHLLKTRFLPLGLIAAGGGSVLAADRERRNSALGVNFHVRLLGPGPIDAVARVLQWLYAPPLLIPMLVGIVGAHWWLYFVHGLAGSIRAALFTPGAILSLLALVVAAALFHEFGHAAALRYGGGKARAMGAGLYLIYPVFYTDVTDSYRLGRWARVRTDVGGFYFHLIFALGTIVFAALTGYEFLLVLVPLIGLELFRQFMPFVRFDGYWALADLTGIPDFFSQILPFLLSMLPARMVTGIKLPRLKPWVRAVFAAYIVTTVPLLIALIFLMVSGLPPTLIATWEALQQQTTLITNSWHTGDVLTLAAASTQAMFLALPSVAAVYIFSRICRSFLRALWRWSARSARRRVAGTLVSAGAASCLALLWAPHLVLFGFGSVTPPDGVQRFDVLEREHVQGAVTYMQVPPVGGNHAPIWQNCGFYAEPVADELAVHSMEHGAVWITYRPDLPQEERDVLRALTLRQAQVLVSPREDLPSPVVASAWSHQLQVDSADDARLEQFVRAFRNSSFAPEPAGPCSGGRGTPT